MFNHKEMYYLTVTLYLFGMICQMRCELDRKYVDDSEDVQWHKKMINELNELKYVVENLNMRCASNETQKAGQLPIFDIRVDDFPQHCQLRGTPSNCGEATVCTKRSGYYEIKPRQFINDTILVDCDAHTEGGDWIVIQRRQDGSVDFYRTWSEYKVGFGDVDGEFFIGLDNLYALTNFYGPQELLILMERDDGTKAYAKYDSFLIGPESEKYVLKRLGRYSGTGGESFQSQIGYKFTTKDQDNDSKASNCAQDFSGAGWYHSCFDSNLNGHYGDSTEGKGIFWRKFSYSLKAVQMMIRRRRYTTTSLYK